MTMNTSKILLIEDEEQVRHLLREWLTRAGALHQLSSRSNGPLVPVNCAAIPSELMESELFGHQKGAFSGASADSRGLFRSADGGTLFLDEVGELPAQMQAKLL